jgi:hypothetical protein
MRHHDIADTIDVINFKISWYRFLAQHVVDAAETENLQSIAERVRANTVSLPCVAKSLIPVLKAEPPLYSSLVGNFICRAVLEKLCLHDPVVRPAPGKIEMGNIEDVFLYYHPDTNEYEVSDASIGVRFTALYTPIFGPDIADEGCAVEIALAINQVREAEREASVVQRFPWLKTREINLPQEKNQKNISNRLINRRH